MRRDVGGVFAVLECHVTMAPQISRLRGILGQLQVCCPNGELCRPILEIDHAHCDASIGKPLQPGFRFEIMLDAICLLAKYILIDGYNFTIEKDGSDCRRHVAQIVAG